MNFNLGNLAAHSPIVFFTGAGLSAESGVPTYRGAGGIWGSYRYQDVACQNAFTRQPQKVLDFHEHRRRVVLGCQPHAGHAALAKLQKHRTDVFVITQNIDGMLQRAGVNVAVELHGSLWRMRCNRHGVREDLGSATYSSRHCAECGAVLRPDITWFEDAVDPGWFDQAGKLVNGAQLFISIGTSAVVWPAAGFINLALQSGATMLELNPQATDASPLFEYTLRGTASELLPQLCDQLTRAANLDG